MPASQRRRSHEQLRTLDPARESPLQGLRPGPQFRRARDRPARPTRQSAEATSHRIAADARKSRGSPRTRRQQESRASQRRAETDVGGADTDDEQEHEARPEPCCCPGEAHANCAAEAPQPPLHRDLPVHAPRLPLTLTCSLRAAKFRSAASQPFVCESPGGKSGERVSWWALERSTDLRRRAALACCAYPWIERQPTNHSVIPNV